MRFEYATFSNPGGREINEDAVVVREDNGNIIVVVADGLGGHEKGEVASKIVSNAISGSVEFHGNIVEELRTAMERAQRCLLEKQRIENAVDAMKTTAVTVAIRGNEAYFAHVGDSRGYVFYKKKKYVRTIDHSVPQMLALAGDIRERDIRNHPDRSSLLRVFGSEWEKEAYEISDALDVSQVKAFLLCSDGFWELITEAQMKWCLLWCKTPKEWLKRMRQIVEKNGVGKEMDNYTAAAIFVKEA